MKISVVMQVYLGEYPNSRSNPKEKFVRAVSSFLCQSHKNKELIIVSDGCQITCDIYNVLYNNEEDIKFFYLERKSNTKSMYHIEGGKISYRGEARQKGVEMATGDIITYMDSDDIILPNHLYNLNSCWESMSEDTEWASNILRIMHCNFLTSPEYKEPFKLIYDTKRVDLSNYGIYDDFVINKSVVHGRILTATIALSHRNRKKRVGANGEEVRWKNIELDCDEKGNIQGQTMTEDTLYFLTIQKTGRGIKIESPTYVVCHYKNIWDC